MNENSSGTNTVLIVIVLLILVAFGVWWFMSRDEAPSPATSTIEEGVNVDVALPGSNPGDSSSY